MLTVHWQRKQGSSGRGLDIFPISADVHPLEKVASQEGQQVPGSGSLRLPSVQWATEGHVLCWHVSWPPWHVHESQGSPFGVNVSPSMYTLPSKLHAGEIKIEKNKTSTTLSCCGPIPAQRIWGNLVPGPRAIFSHTISKTNCYYSHRLSWEKAH